MVPTETAPTVTVHQCLFGYEGGHRLLATSLPLPPPAASLLLMLSDLAPGLTSGDVDNYWTGVPIASMKYYALLRTWRAPEISRPGCVWTHALLVGFADIARFVDLAVLAGSVARPSGAAAFDRYAAPLSFGEYSLRGVESAATRGIAPRDALRVLRAIYGPRATGALSAAPTALDGAIFAAWTQQWPRLRRAFSFRTATSGPSGTIPGVRFDLRVSPGQERKSARPDETPPDGGEAIAIDDLLSAQPTEFRRFLWRYGSDIRQGREHFRFLADVYRGTRARHLTSGALERTLLAVSSALPAPDDGRVLKEDLVSPAHRRYSLVPATGPLATLEFFVRHPETKGLPAPQEEAFEAIRELWPARSAEILALAEQAASGTSVFGDMVLARLADVADPATFLASTEARPKVRRRLIATKPMLLDTDLLLQIPPPELYDLLALLPEDETIARPVLTRLLALDDQNVVADAFVRFPALTMALVSEAVERSVAAGGGAAADSWLRGVAERSALFLSGGFVETARSTRTLAAFAAMLRHDSPAVLRAGPLPWVAALRGAKDDVHGHERQIFLSFLLATALSTPRQGCEPLFEIGFESLHADLRRQALSQDAFSILARHLPEVSWWERWDSCLRLRLGTVTAYVGGDLDPRSFRRLTSDTNLFDKLVQAAEQTKPGHRYIGRLTVR